VINSKTLAEDRTSFKAVDRKCNEDIVGWGIPHINNEISSQ